MPMGMPPSAPAAPNMPPAPAPDLAALIQQLIVLLQGVQAPDANADAGMPPADMPPPAMGDAVPDENDGENDPKAAALKMMASKLKGGK